MCVCVWGGGGGGGGVCVEVCVCVCVNGLGGKEDNRYENNFLKHNKPLSKLNGR